jgi:hypothetical protein
MHKTLLSLSLLLATAVTALAGDNSGHLQVAAGLLYQNTAEVTLGYEHETTYHNAWEYFGSAALHWEECDACGHICPESFWHHYNTWELGVVYKPCVSRGRNHHGNLRLGGALGSDTHDLLGGIHAGYEHTYNLRHGWGLFWQVRTELLLHSDDRFRTGVGIGVKIPT